MARPAVTELRSPYVNVEYESSQSRGRRQFRSITHDVIDFTFTDSGDKRTSKLEFAIDNFDQAYFGDADLMKKGTRVRAAFGYPGMTASLQDFVIKTHKGNRSQMTIECQEKKRTRMGRSFVQQSYTDVRRSDVVDIVARRNGFNGFNGEPTQEVLPQITQANETDWQFLQGLADLEHRELYVSTAGLHWETPQRRQRPSRLYRYVKNAINVGDVINYSIDSVSQGVPGRIVAMGFDPLTGREFKVSASDQDTKDLLPLVDSDDNATPESGDQTAGGGHGQELVLSVGSVTASDAQRRIDALYKSIKYNALKLSLTAIGDPFLRARRIILLVGLGPSLDGLYWVKQVVHRIGSGGYSNSINLTRDGIAKKLGLGKRRFSKIDEELEALLKYSNPVVQAFQFGGF